MTVGIHQPNYLPWLGYFFKMVLSDIFIFHDAVALSKRTYTRRTRIVREKGSTDTRWLTVPLQKHPSDTPCSQVLVDHSDAWSRQHLHKIANSYAHTDHYAEVGADLEGWLKRCTDYESLSAMNTFLIGAIAQKLGIDCMYEHSSQMGIAAKRSNLNAELVQAVGGDTYISGSGGKAYQDRAAFNDQGIELKYHGFEDWIAGHPYVPEESSFVPGLSIIDCLMHCGWQGTADLLLACRKDWEQNETGQPA